MAEVTIKLTDGDKGVLIELMSVPPCQRQMNVAASRKT